MIYEKTLPSAVFHPPNSRGQRGGGQSETPSCRCCPLWSRDSFIKDIKSALTFTVYALIFRNPFFIFPLSSLCLSLFCLSQEGDPVMRTNCSNTPAKRKWETTAVPECRLKRCAGVLSTQRLFNAYASPVLALWLHLEQIYSN